MPKLQTFSRFPVTIHVDGVALSGSVKRLTLDELDTYLLTFNAQRGEAPETDADEKQRERERRVWVREALEAYVTLDPGEYEHDGRDVTSGGQLFDLFYQREDDDVIAQALSAILCENRLSESQKKSYRQLFASRFGLTSERPTTTPGDAPAPAASSVEPSASVDSGGVTAPPVSVPSGTTTLRDARTC